MKNLFLMLLLLASFGAYAQCDALSAKSYTIELGAGKPDKEGMVTCKVNVQNKSKNNLKFELTLWGGKAGGGKAAKVTGDGTKLETEPAFEVGKGKTASKTFKIKADVVLDAKVKVTNTDCKDSGKNTFVDPTFYKATK